MTALEAAIQVLRDAGAPLRYEELTARMLEAGLWTTKGKTPAATVNARLCVSLRKEGEGSPFVRPQPGTFGLREWGSQKPETSSDVGPADSVPTPGQEIAPNDGEELDPVGPSLSFAGAAERVLSVFGKRHPMHYKEITIKALEEGWLETEGKTPEATMYAQVLTEMKKARMRGEQSRFVKHGKGYVGLRKWMGKGLAFQIEQHNKLVRQSLHKQLLKMDPYEFEELIGRLLAEIGFEDIEVTKHGGDGGIDVRGTLVVGEVIRTSMAVQVKRWKRNVQAPTVQQVRGSLGTHDQGLIITTSDFSKGAVTEAELPDRVPVALMNGEQLVALLVSNGIGVSKRSHELIELGEADTEET